MNAEKAVTVAARMYDARRQMRFLHGDKYAERVAQVRPYIEGRMKAANECELEAALFLSRESKNPFVTLLILATAVEMIEPLTPEGTPCNEN